MVKKDSRSTSLNYRVFMNEHHSFQGHHPNEQLIPSNQCFKKQPPKHLREVFIGAYVVPPGG